MIGFSRDGNVVTIELQRHERRNALSAELCIAIRDAMNAAVAEHAHRVEHPFPGERRDGLRPVVEHIADDGRADAGVSGDVGPGHRPRSAVSVHSVVPYRES